MEFSPGHYIGGQLTRCLRIAAAVVFSLLACGELGMWQRSYCWDDGASGPIGDNCFLGVEHCCGLVIVDLPRWDEGPASLQEWTRSSSDAKDIESSIDYWKSQTAHRPGFIFTVRPRNGFGLSVPPWFLVDVSAALATFFACQRTWRFSVRGLLVAMTLLAATLGFAVYAGS